MMNKIRTLIVDDEPLARFRIRELLAQDDDLEVIGECCDGEEAVVAIKAEKPDLVFLDVQMPEMDGFQVVETVGAKNMPRVIFVTAFDNYALRAFEVNALDYLLKPFDDARFQLTLERVKKLFFEAKTGSLDERLIALLNHLQPRREFLDKVLIKNNERLFFLETRQIEWIKANGNYAALHAQSTNYLLRETISNLENQLDPAIFLRISRSVIVNINCVKELQQMFHGDYKVVMKDGTQLMLSRRFRDRLPRVVIKN
jgi:two-component system, LytTR family, response regulator